MRIVCLLIFVGCMAILAVNGCSTHEDHALSSPASASSSFSFAFSPFGERVRFASDTSSPPYLALYL